MGSFETPGLQRWRRATDVPLLILAIGTLPLLALELQRDDLPGSDQFFLDILNAVVLVAFATDYIVELALAAPKMLFVRREWVSLTIVVTQAMAMLPAARYVGVFRVLRVARAWRGIALVARAAAIGGAVASEGSQILRRYATRFILAVAGLTAISSAVVFTLVEDVGVRGREGLDSFFDALWWSATTITTVGYGDLAPRTAAGRVTAVVTMVVGISSFAVVTAKIAEFLIRVGAAEVNSGMAQGQHKAAEPTQAEDAFEPG